MEHTTEWRNIGAWVTWRFQPSAGIRTPWGNVILKRWSDRLYSERHTDAIPHVRIGGLALSWRRLRKLSSYQEMVIEAAQDVVVQSTPLTDLLSRKP